MGNPVFRLARIYSLAREVLADSGRARSWLRTPNQALSGEAPLKLLMSDYGAGRVEELLRQIDAGIYH